MSGKLSWLVEVNGLEGSSVGVRKLQSDVDTLSKSLGKLKGIAVSDFTNFSSGNSNKLGLFKGRPGTKELNPDFFKEAGQTAAQSVSKGFKQAFGAEGRFGGLAKLLGAEKGSGLSNLLTASGALVTAFYGFRLVIGIVEHAFRAMVDAIQRGSKLYLDAAKVGISTSRLAKVRNAAGLIGMDESEVDQLLLRGEFGNRRGGGSATRPGQSRRQGGAISLLGELFGAYGPSQLGDLQKAINLNKELAMAVKDTALASRTEADAARALYEEEYNMKVLWMDLKALFEQLAQNFHFIITGLTAMVDLFAKLAILSARFSPAGIIEHWLVGDDSEKFKKTGVGSGRIPTSQFEKIGFGFGGFGSGGSPADQTAKNSGKAVGLLTSINEGIKQLVISAPKNLGQNGKEKATLEQFKRDHPLNHVGNSS